VLSSQKLGPPGFEPGQTEPKSAVLPLHHGPGWIEKPKKVWTGLRPPKHRRARGQRREDRRTTRRVRQSLGWMSSTAKARSRGTVPGWEKEQKFCSCNHFQRERDDPGCRSQVAHHRPSGMVSNLETAVRGGGLSNHYRRSSPDPAGLQSPSTSGRTEPVNYRHSPASSTCSALARYWNCSGVL
jgi:hypothetical protein